jgi:hypothetical protein
MRSVIYSHQAQSVCGRYLLYQAAIAGQQEPLELLWGHLPPAYQHKRANDTPYHPVEKGIRLDIEPDSRPLRLPPGTEYGSNRVHPLRRLPKGGKVLDANQALAGISHAVQV